MKLTAISDEFKRTKYPSLVYMLLADKARMRRNHDKSRNAENAYHIRQELKKYGMTV